MNPGTDVCALVVVLGGLGVLLYIADQLRIRTRALQIGGAFVIVVLLILFVAWKVRHFG